LSSRTARLAGELAAPVCGLRIGPVELVVGPRCAAVEHIIRRDVQAARCDVGAGERQVARAERVAAIGGGGVGLGVVDEVVRGRVDDQIGAVHAHHLAHRVEVGDVELDARQGDDLMVRERRLEPRGRAGRGLP